MILFSSLTHGIEFLLFVYLGLISGLIFEVVNKTCFKLSQKIKKAENSPLKQKNNKNKTNTQKIVTNTIQQPNKTLKKQKRVNIKKLFNSFIMFLKKIFATGNIYLLKFIPPICLVIVSVASYLVNLQFNLGFVKVVYVLFWVAFFFVGKSLCKLLANYFVAFYNWIIKKVKKCQNKTSTIKENQN